MKKFRGGLLSTYLDGSSVLLHTTGYYRKERKIGLLDECFSAVWKRLRENSNLMKEDIQQHNLFGYLCSSDLGYFSQSRFQYVIDWDPKTLSIPCNSDFGNWLPIHWSSGGSNKTREMFSCVLEAGMKYFPEKFGFLFCEETQTGNQDETNVITGTPFQLICKQFGHDNVIKEVMDQIAKYYPITLAAVAPTSTTTTTTTTTITESSILLLAVTDEKIHLDGLYMLLRRDPTASLSRLQQLLEEEEERQSSDDNATSVTVTISTTASSPSNNNTATTTNNNRTSKKRKHKPEETNNSNDWSDGNSGTEKKCRHKK
jgi:hypothetical protein